MNTWPQPSALPLPRRLRAAAYWTATACVAAELGVGGVWDIARLPYVSGVIAHLGYPSYFLILLGTWKVLGAAALLVPRQPLLKEWAYAGAFFTYTGAMISRLAAGYDLAEVVVLAVMAALTITSWALRPASRRGLSSRGLASLGRDRGRSGRRPGPAVGCCRSWQPAAPGRVIAAHFSILASPVFGSKVSLAIRFRWWSLTGCTIQS